MSIDAGEVRRIAALALLDLDDATVERFREQLAAILDYVATLDDLGVDRIAPTEHVRGGSSGSRADAIVPSLPIDEVLRGAPDSAAGLFRVPKVLSE